MSESELVERLRYAKQVSDRLADQPSNTRGPHCWFCNGGMPWFQCECKDAKAAREGKRAKPRWDTKRGVIVLDEEIIKRNEAWGYIRAPVSTPASVSTAVSSEAAAEAQPVSTDRKAYMRDLMRRRREAAKK